MATIHHTSPAGKSKVLSRLCALFATPVAYLIDAHGVILKDIAVGVEPILQLLSSLAQPAVA